MFALEIDFHDGISPPETILVRRANAIIGSSDRAHVVIEGAASSLCELRLVRGLGREFSCHPVRRPGQSASPPSFLEGVYSGEVELRLGDLTVNVTSLDIDLALGADEFPDRAAIRILRTALCTQTPVFPALCVMGARPIFVSFPTSVPLLIGRSRVCGLRLDASDVSSEHARVGVDSDRCWVEDLGSTNGTYVGDERVSGRRYLNRGESIKVGAEFMLAPILSAEDVSALTSKSVDYPDTALTKTFPCLVSSNEEVRPARFPLKPGAKVHIGRDPANDVWISAPHISRSHVELSWDEYRGIELSDLSSNGTYLDGQRLPSDEPEVLDRGLTVLDFCSGIKIGICYSEEDENAYLSGESESSRPDLAARAEDLAGIGLSTATRSMPIVALPLEQAVNDMLERTSSPERMPQRAAEPSVFERLVQRKVNRDVDQEKPASEFMSEGLGDFNQEEAFPSDGFNAGENGFSGLDDSEPSDFEQYQQRARAGGIGMFDPHPDMEELSDEELDEELFNTPQFGGHGRGFLILLVVGLVIVVLLFCMLLFGNYFY